MVRKVKVSGSRVGRAKRRTTKAKTTHRRRRRVSGTKTDIMGMAEQAGGLILGSVGARELNTIAIKMFPTLTPTMSGLAQMAIGFVLPKMVKGAFFQAVGNGMVANGGMVLVVSTGIINGPNDRLAYRINGTSNLKVIGKTGNLHVVAGTSNLPVVGNTRIGANNTNVRRRFSHYI
jgi:hypothetical protein